METAIVVTKGLCYIAIGGLTPLTSSLSQWQDVGDWPPPVNWVGIVAGMMVGAATQMLSFLSQSYGNYKLEMKNGNGNTQDKHD